MLFMTRRQLPHMTPQNIAYAVGVPLQIPICDPANAAALRAAARRSAETLELHHQLKVSFSV